MHALPLHRMFGQGWQDYFSLQSLMLLTSAQNDESLSQSTSPISISEVSTLENKMQIS